MPGVSNRLLSNLPIIIDSLVSKTRKNDNEDIGKNLTVAVALTKDVGRRIARIDPKVADDLELSTGDAIEISSGRMKTAILNWPAYPQDYGKGLIRIDGYTRNTFN